MNKKVNIEEKFKEDLEKFAKDKQKLAQQMVMVDGIIAYLQAELQKNESAQKEQK